MTVEQAWEALDAAGRIAEVHGVELEPTIRPHALRLAFWRGRELLGVVSITEARLDACEGPLGVRELLEREVTAYLSAKKGAIAS